MTQPDASMTELIDYFTDKINREMRDAIWRPSDRHLFLATLANRILELEPGETDQTVPCTRCAKNPVPAPSDINIDPVCRTCLSEIWHGASALCPDGKGGIRHLALTPPIYAAIHHLNPTLIKALPCDRCRKGPVMEQGEICAQCKAELEAAEAAAGTFMDHSNLQP